MRVERKEITTWRLLLPRRTGMPDGAVRELTLTCYGDTWDVTAEEVQAMQDGLDRLQLPQSGEQK